jgi:hypothetical protein
VFHSTFWGKFAHYSGVLQGSSTGKDLDLWLESIITVFIRTHRTPSPKHCSTGYACNGPPERWSSPKARAIGEGPHTSLLV